MNSDLWTLTYELWFMIELWSQYAHPIETYTQGEQEATRWKGTSSWGGEMGWEEYRWSVYEPLQTCVHECVCSSCSVVATYYILRTTGKISARCLTHHQPQPEQGVHCAVNAHIPYSHAYCTLIVLQTIPLFLIISFVTQPNPFSRSLP